MSNEEPVQDGNTRNEREKATNRNSLPPTRREISFHLSSQLCVWLASLSPPIVSPRGDSFVLDADPEGKMKALVRDPGRGSWRENRCNTRKRFGQFNPLKRMARRREKVGARSRKRPTLVWQPPSSSSSSFLSTLPDSSYVFLSSSSLSLRKGGRVSVFFPNDKTKRERSFFAPRLQHPPSSISIQDRFSKREKFPFRRTFVSIDSSFSSSKFWKEINIGIGIESRIMKDGLET